MERFALAAYALLAGALLLAGWAPDPRTWGLHALAFLPRVAWMAALLFCAALAAPRVAARFGVMVIATAGWVLGSWRRTAGAAVAAGALFALLRLRFQFLGDGVVWLEKIEHRQAFHHFEPLATAVVSWIAHLDPRFERGAGWPAIAFGVAYVLAAAGLCRAAWREPGARALGWFLLVVHPLVLVFFGYIESYPGLLVLQVLFTWALLGGGRAGPALATGILAVAIAWHLQAVVWLPALVALPWLRGKGDSGEARHGSHGSRAAAGAAAAALAVGLALLVVRAIGASPLRMLGELWGSEALGTATPTALFSLRHVIDLANEIALLCGSLLVLAAATAACPRIRFSGRWALVTLLLGGAVCFALLVVPRIGGARDWDLYLTLVVPATLLGVEAWRRLGRASGAAEHVVPHPAVVFAGRAAGLALVTTLASLAVELDAPRAARRMETVVDPRGTFGNFARGYANETLGIYYRDRDMAAARRAYARAVQANPANARYHNNLGNTELRLGNIEAARDAFQRAADLGMREWYVLQNLGAAHLHLHQLAAAESIFAEVARRWPDRWLGHACLAEARIQMGRPGDALPEIERARALAPGEAEVHFFLGLALRDLGRREEARTAFAEALRLDPKHERARRALVDLEITP